MDKEEIKNALIEFQTSFAKDRQSDNSHYSELPSYQILTQTLPRLFKEKAYLYSNKYTYKGSIGQGRFAKIPWLSIFDNDITESALNGYYIVYLFQNDLKGFYLSLNQGWTQYEDVYKVKIGKEKILENKNKAKVLLKGTSGFSFEDIKLNASGRLPEGYELGNICSKYYSFSSIPEDNELIDDLRNLVGVYRELKGLIGTSIFNLGSIKTESEFQTEIQEIKNSYELKAGPIEKPQNNGKYNNCSWNRNPRMSANAIIKAGRKCENCSSHQTFTSNSGMQFMEAHHLIPMKYQDKFTVSIDVPENIICLCPNCHRAFHLANDNDRTKLVEKFYNDRKDELKERGIEISLNKLLKFYNKQ